MTIFRIIKKLKVDVAKGITIIDYDDNTKRRICNQNTGFKFNCGDHILTNTQSKSYDPKSLKMSVEGIIRNQNMKLPEVDKIMDLECPDVKLSNTDLKNDKELIKEHCQLDILKLDPSQTSTELLTILDTDGAIQSISDTIYTEKINILGASDSDNKTTSLSELNNIYPQRDSDMESQLGSETVSLLELFKNSEHRESATSIRTLNNSDSKADSELTYVELNRKTSSEQLCSMRIYETWHLKNCLEKGASRIPVCNCLKVKDKLADLENKLNEYMNLSKDFTGMRDQEILEIFVKDLNIFLQDVTTSMQEIYKLLINHIHNI